MKARPPQGDRAGGAAKMGGCCHTPPPAWSGGFSGVFNTDSVFLDRCGRGFSVCNRELKQAEPLGRGSGSAGCGSTNAAPTDTPLVSGRKTGSQ